MISRMPLRQNPFCVFRLVAAAGSPLLLELEAKIEHIFAMKNVRKIKTMGRAAMLLTLLVLFFPGAVRAQTAAADLVIVNASVRTMDAENPRAEAIAVTSGKISAVGSNSDIRRLTGPATKTIDAGGRLVLPGFNDSHVHFMGIGGQFFSLNLSGTRTPAAVLDKIRHYVRFLPAGEWVRGSGWNHELWAPAQVPTMEMIDPLTPEHPVFLYHANGRTALVNSLTLKLARIDKSTKDPAGGEIVRDASGEPTGVLHGAAAEMVRRLAPVSIKENRIAVAEAATRYAASLGVTSVQDMQTDDNLEIYRELARQGKLKTRVYECIGLPDWKKLADAGVKRATGDALLRRGCLKSFSDGDDESVPELYPDVLAADKAGLQIMLHAVGGRANSIILSIFERAAKENGARDRRFRVEHAHNFRPEDLKRFAAAKIVASMQPALFFGANPEPYRALLDSGAAVAFGSDASIIDLNPLDGILAAAAAPVPNRITIEEAVRAYTAGSAFAEFQEDVKGTITPGKLADLVILSDDIFAVSPNEIRKTRVVTTIMNGEIVYEAK